MDYAEDVRSILLTKGGSRGPNSCDFKLAATIGALKIYNVGLTPYKGFRVKDIKDYYGVKGNKQKVLEDLELLLKRVNKSLKRVYAEATSSASS